MKFSDLRTPPSHVSNRVLLLTYSVFTPMIPRWLTLMWDGGCVRDAFNRIKLSRGFEPFLFGPVFLFFVSCKRDWFEKKLVTQFRNYCHVQGSSIFSYVVRFQKCLVSFPTEQGATGLKLEWSRAPDSHVVNRVSRCRCYERKTKSSSLRRLKLLTRYVDRVTHSNPDTHSVIWKHRVTGALHFSQLNYLDPRPPIFQKINGLDE